MTKFPVIIQIEGPFRKSNLSEVTEFGEQRIYSENPLVDADLVLLDLKNQEQAFPTGRSMPQKSADRFDEAIKVKREHLLEYLEMGRTVVAFVAGTLNYFVLDDNSQGQYVRRNSETIFSDIVDLVQKPIQGVNIEMCFGELGDSLLYSEGELIFEYKHSLNPRYLDYPLMKVKDTDFYVGGIKKIGKGHVFFLPDMRNSYRFSTNEQAYNFLINLNAYVDICIGEIAQNKTIEEDHPAWLLDIKILNDLDLELSINEVKQEIAQKQMDLDGLYKMQNAVLEIKKCLYASGDSLEESVEAIFEYFHFDFERLSGQNRVDFILRSGNRTIVCEVKGVSKTAKESFATQLDKWGTEYYESHKVLPMGLLIVGTHRNLPLEQRPDNDFPDQMMSFVKIKNQACITTVTLMKLLERFDDSKIDTDGIFDLFYESVGEIKI